MAMYYAYMFQNQPKRAKNGQKPSKIWPKSMVKIAQNKVFWPIFGLNMHKLIRNWVKSSKWGVYVLKIDKCDVHASCML